MQTQYHAFLHECIREIQDAMQNDRLAVFVGSGISIDSGLPSWQGIIEAFAEGIYGEKWRDKLPFSSDDYKKIPQMYYDTHGRVSYYNRLTPFFDGKYEPNQLHKAIFALNPIEIITTNYDSLLEQTTQILNVKYDSITTNEDLSYVQRKRILKMHGDFTKRNIVLKEDDYDTYFQSFELIADNVKSILAGYTTLLIGYSAKDSDFNLLLQSLKHIQQDSMRMLYMLDTSKFDQDEFDKKKANSIKVLYYDSNMENLFTQSDDRFKQLVDERSKKTLRLLEYVRTYPNIIKKANVDEQPSINDNYEKYFDEIYSLLLPLDKFTVILPSDIIQAISPRKLRVNNNLLYVNDKRIAEILHPYFTDKKYYQNLSSATQEKVRHIRSILTKAEIINVCLDNDVQFVLAKRYQEQRFEDTVSPQTLQMFYFDYVGLSQSIAKEYPAKFVAGNEQQMFEKAFFLYKLGRAKEANDILRDIVNAAFEARNYRLYFLAAFNKQNLYARLYDHILEMPGDSKTTFPLWQQVEQEFDAESIRMEELEEELSQLSKSEQRSLRFIKRILNFDFVSAYFTDALRSKERLDSEKRIVDRGGLAMSGAMYQSYQLQRQLWHFINQNYLIAEQFQETIVLSKSLLEGLWTSYATKYTKRHYEHPTFGNMLSRTRPTQSQMRYEVLYWTIERYKDDELQNLFEKLGITSIEVEDKSQEQLIQALENLILSEYRVPSNQIPYYQYISSTILLLSYLRFTTKEAANTVLDILTRYLQQHSFLDTRMINRFLVLQKDPNNATFTSDALEKLLQVCLDSISKYPVEGLDFLTVLVENICGILQKQNGILQSLQAIESIQELVNDSTLAISTRYLLANNVLVPIQPILEINKKERNSSVVVRTLSELSALPEQTSEFLKLFYAAVWGKVIEPETSQIQALMTIVKQALTKIESIEDADDKKKQRERVSDYAGQIAHLLLRGRIQHHDIEELVPLLQGRQLFFDYVTAPESFNFAHFDISWLLYFSPEQIDNLAQVEQHKTILREKILGMLEASIKPSDHDRKQYLSILKNQLF